MEEGLVKRWPGDGLLEPHTALVFEPPHHDGLRHDADGPTVRAKSAKSAKSAWCSSTPRIGGHGRESVTGLTAPNAGPFTKTGHDSDCLRDAILRLRMYY